MATTTPNYDINYEDERFQTVESDKEAALSQFDQTYQGMIDGVDKQYQGLTDTIKQNAEVQKQNQQANTDFTIEKIEQQKEQQRKEYLKEQSGAYQDWQKQSNKYGVNAEQMAASGMTNTGFSESSQVAMYNTYQNRVATAKETLSLAMMNYDNNIKEAMLQNNSILAEIEANAALEAAKLSLEGFQYKNTLILEQANKRLEIDNMYYQRWRDVLAQMNTENAMREEVRQYEQNFAEDVRQYEKTFAEDQRQFAETQKFQAQENQKDRDLQKAEKELDRQHDLKITDINNKFKAKEADLDRKHDVDILNAKNKHEKEMADKEHKQDLEKLKKQHEYELAQADKDLENEKALLKYQKSLTSSSPGSSGGTIKKTTSSSSGTPKSSGNKSQISQTGLHETEPQSYTHNQASIKALGRGNLTGAQLAKMVKSGEVIQYVKNGQYHYKYDPNYRHTAAVKANLAYKYDL